MTIAPLSWTELEALTDYKIDRINGPTNSQSTLRLFGQTESGCGWKKNRSLTASKK